MLFVNRFIILTVSTASPGAVYDETQNVHGTSPTLEDVANIFSTALADPRWKLGLIILAVLAVAFIIVGIIGCVLLDGALNESSTIAAVLAVGAMATSFTIVLPIIFLICGFAALKKKRQAKNRNKRIKRKPATEMKFHSVHNHRQA